MRLKGPGALAGAISGFCAPLVWQVLFGPVDFGVSNTQEVDSWEPARNFVFQITRGLEMSKRNTISAMSADGGVRRDRTSDLQLLIDSTPGLIHTGRPDGYLDFFNRTWLTYIGRPLENLQGWNWTAFIHPEDVEGMVEKWRASLASGEPYLDETRVLRADGEYRWMLHHKVALRDGRGQIVRWYGS